MLGAWSIPWILDSGLYYNCIVYSSTAFLLLEPPQDSREEINKKFKSWLNEQQGASPVN